MNFKAAVLKTAGSPLSIEQLKIANLGESDVLVRIKATSLCHTDLEAVEGQLASPLPLVPGHEAAGIVEWVGKSVRNSAVGDHVVISWNPHCNHCFYCARQQPILCQQYRDNASLSLHFDGKARLFLNDEPVHQLMYAGTFAEMAVVTESCAVKIPEDMPLDLACLIGCGVMTGVGAALNIAKVEAGSSASIIGCGAVGLSAIQGAKLAGAEKIIAIDRDPAKLEIARKFGATHTLIAGASLIPEHAALTSGRGADYVFEAAGNQAGFRASVEIVRPGGQVVWLGKVPVNQDVAFRWGSLMGEKKIVRSSYGGTSPEKDFPFLVKAYLEGKLLLDEYVTGRIRLDGINLGLQRLKQGLEIRSVIEF
ncbi:MAG TPA: Zn-dependent alcohol dehydrogenase [Burkholderiaceae bacterium]|nr:Zn-dependent alcohol dehydrogenase [Burkholderiaceae bacterium]